MIVNASVFVKDGDVNKALEILKRKLKKQGLWGYDQEKRHCQKEQKKEKRKN